MSSTVSESQAYPGMGKVVLVESKREEATDDVIRQVVALNQGQFQERVEVWDWRVLEELSGHVLAGTGRRWFLGATIVNDGKAVFVWNRSRV
jgi:DNA ligase-4